ncbi:MAG: hypothetical protein LAO31_02770 [Acidobacteriia bacterium]|nr:hypothetical protein [Terriglobia bacterium]
MFIGHLGVGLALKRADRNINVGILIFAALFFDFILGALVLLGVEHVVVPANYRDLHYLTFSFPYSHGLLAAFLWSTLALLAAERVWPKGKQPGTRIPWIIAVAVFSHFLTDLIVHVAEMPVAGARSYMLGLGLWNHLYAALVLEGLLVVAGLTLYLKSAGNVGRPAKYGMILFMIFLSASAIIGQAISTVPPGPRALAVVWLVQAIVVAGIAFWLDRERPAVAA